MHGIQRFFFPVLIFIIGSGLTINSINAILSSEYVYDRNSSIKEFMANIIGVIIGAILVVGSVGWAFGWWL